ncbi:MAG: phage portal protein [Alphaproteobacteria bacterium]|nr:phage portal protein [Alphaproteobacteria bacterium]
MSFLQRLGFGQNTGKKPKTERKNYVPLTQYGHEFGFLMNSDFTDDIAIAAMARHAYMQNPIAHRAVRMIAEAAASVQLQLFIDDEELIDHPLLNLIAHPNMNMSGYEFLEQCYSQLLIDGNCYLQQSALDDIVPDALYSLRPDRVRLVVDERGWPTCYEYKIGSQKLKFNQLVDGIKPILHQTFYNPNDDHYGQSPFKAARLAIEIHNAASKWNKSLLNNSARPSGAVVYKGQDGQGNLTDEQFDRLKYELEQTYQGHANAGRPMILEGGLDWSAMGFSPKDMDFIDAKHVAAREIALALGVPPMLLGIPGDNRFSNYQEANRNFLRQTILPLVTRFIGNLSSWLNPAWDERLVIKLDLDKIEALSSEREALWRRIGAASFLTTDEKRLAVGYPALAEGESLDETLDSDEVEEAKYE